MNLSVSKYIALSLTALTRIHFSLLFLLGWPVSKAVSDLSLKGWMELVVVVGVDGGDGGGGGDEWCAAVGGGGEGGGSGC